MELDVEEISSSAERLMRAYADSIRAVDRLPMFGFIAPDLQFEPDFQKTHRARARLVSWMRPLEGFAVRPVARLLLEAHIASRMRSLSKSLHIEVMGCLDDSKRTRRLNELTQHIERHLGTFGSPSPFAHVWRFAVALGGLLPATAITAWVQSHDVFLTLMLFVVSVFYAWLLLHTLIVVGGFKWKRILLCGGERQFWLSEGRSYRLVWVQFRSVNTYKLEQEVFAILGVPKPLETPFDLWLDPMPWYFAVYAVSVIGVALAETIHKHSYPSTTVFALVFLSALFTVLLFWMTRHRICTYAYRRSAGTL